MSQSRLFLALLAGWLPAWLAAPAYPQLPNAPHIYRSSDPQPKATSSYVHSMDPQDSADHWRISHSLSGSPRHSPPARGFVTRNLRRFAQDQKDIYSAPFRPRNLKWDALVLGGTGALVTADESASRNLPHSNAYISRDISNAAAGALGAIVGSTWLYGLKTGNAHTRETGELTLEALANTFSAYAATQLITGRERPYQGTGEGRFWRDHSVNTSFPSGHAMFSFAMAGVMAHEYPRPLVQALAYGAAGAVAATRFTGREHFVSDVAVGSVLGYLVSREIFYTRCKLGVSTACRKHH